MAVTTYTTAGSGTWLCPAGVFTVQAECWGGGGTGQTLSGSTGGRGGGGGEYALDTVAVTPGKFYAWTVANASGTSTFAGDTLTVRAHGGQSGASGGAGGSGSTNATHFSGGSGAAGGSAGAGGGGGSSAGTAAGGNNGTAGAAGTGGPGGSAPAGGGAGGQGASGGIAAPFPGIAPGGGGGGGNLDYGGGSGAHGQVRLTYTLTTQPVIPYFPAGYAPLNSDFDNWIQAPFSFLTSKVVFRAEQSNALSLTNNVNTLIPFNNVLEDPLSGWESGASQWLCPAGYSGLYSVTLTTSAQSNASNPILQARIGVDSAAQLYTVCKTVVPNGGPAGLASGSQPVQLFGGADSVQGYVIVIGAAGAVATNAGQRCTLTIEWSSL